MKRKKQLQEEILLKLFECLNPAGHLILSMCETMVGSALDRYERTDNTLRIFRRPLDDVNEIKADSVLSQSEIDRILEEMLRGGVGDGKENIDRG